MKIRKVLYFLDTPYSFGGAASTVLKQALAVKKHISNILITIPVDDKGFTIEEFSDRCKEYGLPYSFQKYSTSITTEMTDVIGLSEDYKNIVEYIEHFKPDLVHSAQVNVCVELACRRLGIPHIMNIYQCTEYNFPMLYPDIFPHYHICDSEFYLNKWKKRLQLDSICIRNACEMTKEKKIISSVPSLICVGGISKRKNQLELIKAVHRLILENMPVHVRLMGDVKSEYGKECIKYVEQNDLGKWVEICGHIPFAEKEIAKSEALVCSSTNESFPNVVETAMASRTIVISTPVAGVPELLKDNENAYMCTGYKAEDLYMAIKRFYIQRGTITQKNLIEIAFQTYLNEFSQEVVGSKLLFYYDYVYKNNSVRNIRKIKIENILTPYAPYISLFREHRISLRDFNSERYMIWLIPYIKKSLQDKSCDELIIWGAGSYGLRAIEFSKLYFPQVKIRCVIDKYKKGKYLGHPIVRAENANWKNSQVWIAFMQGQMEAVQILQDLGMKYHKDFFFLAPVNL